MCVLYLDFCLKIYLEDGEFCIVFLVVIDVVEVIEVWVFCCRDVIVCKFVSLENIVWVIKEWECWEIWVLSVIDFILVIKFYM